MSKNSSEKPKTPTSQGIIDSCDFPSNAASTQDCTGLIPSGPVNEDELESYEAAISLSATPNQRYLPK